MSDVIVETEYEVIKDHSDIRAGDLVRLSYDGHEFEGEVWLSRDNGLYVGPAFLVFYKNKLHGRKVISVRRPIPPLPTEPGVYQDKYGDLWQLSAYGWTRQATSPTARPQLFNEFVRVKVFAPFVRLVPEVKNND